MLISAQTFGSRSSCRPCAGCLQPRDAAVGVGAEGGGLVPTGGARDLSCPENLAEPLPAGRCGDSGSGAAVCNCCDGPCPLTASPVASGFRRALQRGWTLRSGSPRRCCVCDGDTGRRDALRGPLPGRVSFWPLPGPGPSPLCTVPGGNAGGSSSLLRSGGPSGRARRLARVPARPRSGRVRTLAQAHEQRYQRVLTPPASARPVSHP